MQWDGCDRYYLSLCGGGGMTSLSRVVKGWERNSVVVGDDRDVSDVSAAVVTVSLVRVVPLSITRKMILERIFLFPTQ